MAQSHSRLQAVFRNGQALPCHLGCRLDNIPTPAIVEADIENQVFVFTCQPLSLRQTVLQRLRQTAALSRKMQLHAFGMQTRDFCRYRLD